MQFELELHSKTPCAVKINRSIKIFAKPDFKVNILVNEKRDLNLHIQVCTFLLTKPKHWLLK